MKKIILVLFLIFSTLGAQTIPGPQDIFRTPPFYGNKPTSICWSAGDSAIAFIWNKDGYRYGDIWLINIPSGKQQKLTDLNSRNSDDPGNAIKNLCWFPNRQRLLFSHKGDIYSMNIRSGNQVEAIATTAAEEIFPQVSPDGQYISFLRDNVLQLYDINRKLTTALSQALNGCWQSLQPQSTYFWSPGGNAIVIPDYEGIFAKDILLFNLQDNRNTRLSLSRDKLLIVRDIIWIQAEKMIVVDYLTADLAQRNIVTVDLSNQSIDTLYSCSAELWCSNFGSKLFWLEAEQKVLFGDNQNGYQHIFTVGLDLKTLNSITRGKWTVFDYTVNNSDGQIYFSANRDKRNEKQIYAYNKKTDKVINLSYMRGCHDFILSNDGKYFIDIYSSSSVPHRLYFTKTSPVSKAQTLLIPDTRVPNPSHLETVLDKKIRCQDTDDYIQYQLWYPEGHLSSDKYPLIIYLNRSQAPIALLDEWNPSALIAQWLSSKGYVVVHIDYPPLAEINVADPWETQLNAINSVIDGLADNEFIDMSRIGITGFHYNGYLGLMALLEMPERIKSENYWDQPVTFYEKLIFDKIAATTMSPALDSPDIARLLYGKLLLIQSGTSTLKPLLDTEKTVQQLVNQKKQIDFIFYPWEGDIIRTDQTYIDIMHKLLEFFEHNL